MPICARKPAVDLAFQSSSGAPIGDAPLVNTCCIFRETADSTGIPAAISGETPLTSAGRFAEDLAPGREVQAMTNRRQLIRNASCWAVALSLATALSTTESEAQPSGRPPSGPRPPS